MATALRDQFRSGQTPTEPEKDSVTLLAKMLVWGAVSVAGAYVLLMFVMVSR